jgi:probable addiction module antidote protein
MKLKKFDAVDFLDSDEAMVEYLNAALEEDDPRYFAHALGNVARAKGMSSIDNPASAPSATQDTFPG